MKKLWMVAGFVILMGVAGAVPPSWDFSSGLGNWTPNGHLANGLGDRGGG